MTITQQTATIPQDQEYLNQPLAAVEELLDLEDKTAVVTGGAMGIGLAIIRRLHDAGACVVIADPDAHRTGEVERLNQQKSDSALAMPTDVSDEQQVKELFDQACQRFDGVDILINNAGIYPPAPLLSMETDFFRRSLEVNLVGMFTCTREAANCMIDHGDGGNIVNVTSIDAVHPSDPGLSHYDASKHGAWGFTKSAALELAQFNIRVNAIAPGGIKTPGLQGINQEALAEFEDKIPMKRMGSGDEIATATLFLCSDMASYVTGAQLVVDGGRLLS